MEVQEGAGIFKGRGSEKGRNEDYEAENEDGGFVLCGGKGGTKRRDKERGRG